MIAMIRIGINITSSCDIEEYGFCINYFNLSLISFKCQLNYAYYLLIIVALIT